MKRRDIEVRTLRTEDLANVAALHQRAFPDSVLGHLGAQALIRYYRWQLFGPHDVTGLGVFDGERMLAFLVGGRFRGSMIGFVKRHGLFLAGRVLRHPTLIVQRRGLRAIGTGLRLLARPFARMAPERPDRVPAASFGVLAVAVAPGAARQGIGTLLEAEACDRARNAGFARMHLTLDPQNPPGLAFYQERGWNRLGIPGDSANAWLMGKEL